MIAKLEVTNSVPLLYRIVSIMVILYTNWADKDESKQGCKDQESIQSGTFGAQ